MTIQGIEQLALRVETARNNALKYNNFQSVICETKRNENLSCTQMYCKQKTTLKDYKFWDLQYELAIQKYMEWRLTK